MWPCVSTIHVTKCAVGILKFEWPEDVFPMISHVLGISKFEGLGDLGVCYFIIFPKVVG